MATKMNLMKLVQEVEGFAQLANRRPQARTSGPFVLGWQSPLRAAAAKHKRTLHITVKEVPDIPHPVRIRQLAAPAPADRVSAANT